MRKILLLLLLLIPLSGFCQELTVAAAADLQFAMQDVAARFEKQSGTHVNVIYGSSGTFYQQLENAAPFDMFFSANMDYPKKLVAENLAEPDSYYEYAHGRIVLWVRSDSKLDLQKGLEVLAELSVRKIAIANPEHAPYGQAAVAAMQQSKVYDKAREKLVFGENISQAANFVASGSADVGIVALSLALSPGMKKDGRFKEIPTSEYPPIRQACVIIRASRHQQIARTFESFLRSREISELLRSYGFDIPREEH